MTGNYSKNLPMTKNCTMKKTVSSEKNISLPFPSNHPPDPQAVIERRVLLDVRVIRDVIANGDSAYTVP
jgi:hypothetical protein